MHFDERHLNGALQGMRDMAECMVREAGTGGSFDFRLLSRSAMNLCRSCNQGPDQVKQNVARAACIGLVLLQGIVSGDLYLGRMKRDKEEDPGQTFTR